MTSDLVLILAQDGDPSASAVKDALEARGLQTLMLDFRGFPLLWSYAAQLSDTWNPAIQWLDDVQASEVDLTGIAGIYVRRPGQFLFSPVMDRIAAEFASVEARAGVLGTLMSLRTRWVNHPAFEHVANYKPIQLSIAKEVGLDPPDTLVTNQIDSVVAFIDAHRAGVVYKGMGRYLSPDPVSLPMPATRTVSREDVHESVALTANLFQELVDKTHDVRLFVTGKRQCAVSIRSPKGLLDWRRDHESLIYEIVAVPTEVSLGVSQLMSRLRLAYGALDFAVSSTGTWRFLEVNPNGQWLWLERIVGIGVSNGIAETLIEGREFSVWD